MQQPDHPGELAHAMRQTSFTSLVDGARSLAGHVLELLPQRPGQSVLDLGTASGDLAMILHAARPDLAVTGLDLAPANIAAAQLRSDEIQFVCVDYLAWEGGPFHLIVADGVLHLVEVPAAQLAAKLAGDLHPGGFLVATVPDAVLRNHLLLVLRRLYRLLPKAADRLALTVAGWVYRDFSRQELADRLLYMRLLPRLFGSAEHAAFAAAGLHLEANPPWPSLSIAKLRHRLMVWRRKT